MSEGVRAITAVVHGRVQGVGFRYHATQRARQLGLTGWIRNRSDGAVELVACGPEPSVGAFVAFLEVGPSGSRVERVVVSDATFADPSEGFSIR